MGNLTLKTQGESSPVPMGSGAPNRDYQHGCICWKHALLSWVLRCVYTYIYIHFCKNHCVHVGIFELFTLLEFRSQHSLIFTAGGRPVGESHPQETVFLGNVISTQIRQTYIYIYTHTSYTPYPCNGYGYIYIENVTYVCIIIYIAYIYIYIYM